uniref:Bromo domain-containing protein n=1 Tax=Trichobilharzia regenti TaxID=157069 RepID=A0AA85JNX5_TRIRE|nr:unnamed protein product [Trichobilharzia regenti]
MDWAVGPNYYLLRAVQIHGKDWDIVCSSLKALSKTFLKKENLQGLSKQSCSLQYNYIIASTRQKNPGDLTENQLLTIALDRYTTLRREQLHAVRLEILRTLKIAEEDAEKLRQAEYSEIPSDRLIIYRKRCRTLGIPDKIGQCLNLGPLSPVPEKENKVSEGFPASPKRPKTEMAKEVVDKDGGIWLPVRSSCISDLFKENQLDDHHDRTTKFVREQSVISQRLGLEGRNDDISSLDTTSSVQTHSEVASIHNQEVRTEDPPRPCEPLTHFDHGSSETELQGGPSKCLEVHAEPITPNSPTIVSDSETLASPHFTQSLNSSPSLSNIEVQSPYLKNANRNRKRSPTKRKDLPTSASTTTAPLVCENQEPEFTSALSPAVSTNLANEECTDTIQSIHTIVRRWRRSLLSALSTVCSHRHAYVFMHPVTEDIAPGYNTVVYEPVDLTSIRRRMESSLSCLIGAQLCTASNLPVSFFQVIIDVAKHFIRDLLLMIANARMYNSQNHEVHRMAGEMYHDMISELQLPWSVMAENIPGFPSLPDITSDLKKPPRTVVHQTPSSADASPSYSASVVLKEEESGGSKQCTVPNAKQLEHPTPEVASPTSSVSRDEYRQSSGNDSADGSVTTRNQ